MTSRRKGGGPTSAAGKAIASRIALRHGFTAKLYRRSPAPERIERLASAIVGNDGDPAVVAAAFKIAENELLLSEIAAHKVWVVERLREPYANPLTSKDNSLQLETARAMQAWLADREINARLPALFKKYERRLLEDEFGERIAAYIASHEANEKLRILFPDDAERAAFIRNGLAGWVAEQYAQLAARGWRYDRDDIVPTRLKALLEQPEEPDRCARSGPVSEAAENGSVDRNEYEALEAAIRDLIRLDRYERRAWSRQKRAFLELASIKLERRLRHDAGRALA
jgi:hypothetical protein